MTEKFMYRRIWKKLYFKRHIRKIITLLLVTVMLCSITGCGSEKEGLSAYGQGKRKEKAEAPKEEITYQDCTVGLISFQVDGSLEPYEGQEGTFVSKDRKSVYQLQGVSMMGAYEPEEFLEELKTFYKEEGYEILEADNTAEQVQTADGTDCYLANIKMQGENVFFCVDVLMAPDKNTVVTYAAQCAADTKDRPEIRPVTLTTRFERGSEDYMTGSTLVCDDGSELCLEDDGNFIYYQKEGEHGGPYYEGSYEVYYGQDAFDKVSSMEEYGLTKEELEEVLSHNLNGYQLNGPFPGTSADEEGYTVCRDTFYAIILHNKKQVDGENVVEFESDALHIGYYVQELELFDMVNCNVAAYSVWQRK